MTKKDSPFATLDDINAIVLVADANGSIIFANKAIKTILGYNPEEVLGDGWWELTSDGENTGTRKAKTAAMANGKESLKDRHLFENLLPAKDGRKVWTQWTNTRTADGFLVGTAQDITEKKKLEEELIRKNCENELLLKEIHHRVKNNLQIISSLLNLQFNNIDNKLVHEALSKSKARINSMALIHTKLYQSENLSSINFGEYINELTASITTSYSTNDSIKCSVKQSQAIFDIDLSINLGLIITELLTNAYKHAFKGRTEGEIQIELTNKAGKHELIIADNGVGIMEDRKNSQSLGLEIVKALTEQINGTIDFSSNCGVKYVIAFEKKENNY
ncbi:MAG: PAS domain S-box protein [Flavobacteriales bacterium]|nr:PAS domain S-box protein [Flavobacteriales bacterium]NQX98656.1 PAS domain S-box protein [Flavobacteriales bacterium]